MRLLRIPALAALLLLLPTGSLRAGQEVLDLDPLAEKNLKWFKVEGPGRWSIDDKSDDVYTLIVCPKAKADSSLVFVRRKFTHGFQVRLKVTGGSKYKGLELCVVPPKGEWISVPFKQRVLGRKGWHELTLTVHEGKAHAQVDDEKGEAVEVPEGPELTFAIRLRKRHEARFTFRKPPIRFLSVSEEQRKPEEGFVRIYDGKSDAGWHPLPAEAAQYWKFADNHIEGRSPRSMRRIIQLNYGDGVFRNFVLRFRVASGCQGLTLVARLPSDSKGTGQTVAEISGYIPGDRDWSDVEWAVQGRKALLKVNGTTVSQLPLAHENPVELIFGLTPGANVKIRDIRVKGVNMRPGPSWARYARESGAASGFGGRAGPGPGPGGAHGGPRGPATRVLFDGKNIDDWPRAPSSGVWSVVDGRLVGLTLEKKTGGEIRYGKLVFTDYRIVFKVQSGTAGAKFIARRVPPQVAKRPEAVVDIKPEWLSGEWTEFEATVIDTKLTLKAGGKVVATAAVPKERGFIGFRIGPNSAIGLKDITWHRP